MSEEETTLTEPHAMLQTAGIHKPPSDLSQDKLSERDMQRICELLARFSQYTQQFEREEETLHDNHSEKAETLGTLSEGMADTRTTHRRTRRAVSKTIHETTT